MQKIIVFFCVILLVNSLSFNSLSQTTINPNSVFEKPADKIEPEGASAGVKDDEVKVAIEFDEDKIPEVKNLYKHKLNSYDELIVYDDVLISLSKEALYLYNKDLIVNWQMSLVTHNVKQLYAEFDTVYSINQDNLLTIFSVNSGIRQTFDDIKLESFVIKYPFLLANFKKEIKMIDLNSQDVLWAKDATCEEKIIFSSAKYSGCLNKNKLTIYDTISGEKISRMIDSKLQNASYMSSTNSDAFFKSKKGQIVRVNLDLSEISNSLYSVEDTSFIVRQKELIQVSGNNKIQCIDLNSKKIKWEKEFALPIVDIVSNQNFLLLKFPSQNVRIIDNFNGDNVYSFRVKESLEHIDSFYSYKKKWYLINNKSNAIISVK